MNKYNYSTYICDKEHDCFLCEEKNATENTRAEEIQKKERDGDWQKKIAGKIVCVQRGKSKKAVGIVIQSIHTPVHGAEHYVSSQCKVPTVTLD